MINRSFRRDFLSFLVVLEYLRLEGLQRFRLAKSRIEYRMLFVPPRLLLRKELLLVEDVRCFMLVGLLIT
jgi:hypothetical protein